MSRRQKKLSMPAPILPNPGADLVMAKMIFERNRETKKYELRTASLAALCEVMGSQLLTSFFRCFIHADRVTSLGTMFHVSRQGVIDTAVRTGRETLTFHYFMVGTLKEYSFALGGLRAALHHRRLFDEGRWNKGLKIWEQFGERSEVSDVRNYAAFHVDNEILAAGVAEMAREGKAVVILHGDTNLNRDSEWPAAQDALARGLRIEAEAGKGTPIPPDRILEAMGDLKDFLFPSKALDPEFIRVLERLGLEPIKVTVSGMG
jgi:hypothetical protein